MDQLHANSRLREELDRLGLSDPDISVMVPPFFGQCAEDYICLSLLRALATREGLDLTKESYAEVGAYHPVAGSSTYLLYRGLGMTGVLIEANPALLPVLSRHRPHDRVLHLCVTPKQQDFATLHIACKRELSSIDPNFLEQFSSGTDVALEAVKVPAITLSALLAQEFSKAPLMLSIDLEGIDRAVIESFDFAMRPFIIQIEASEDHDRAAFCAIERTLTGQDYRILARTDVNQIAVDMRRLSSAGTDSSLDFGTAGIDQMLDHVDLLSLDVFDTILARRATNPVDVFHWLEISEGWKGFADARVAAEAAARRKYAGRGREVSLEEIYEVLATSMPLPDSAMAKELGAEVRFLYSNPTILRLIARARMAGRRVVAISDIYLSSSQVTDLLRSAGVNVDAVYSSSDFRKANLGKYNGKLFSHVLAAEGVKADRVLHIGDNLVSDIANAQVAGLCAIETKQLHQLYSLSDPHAMAIRPLIETSAGSLVLGQYTQWLSQVGSSRSMIESFGYAYGGPLLVGFAQYLVSRAKAAGISRLLLLERDGSILAATFKALGITDVEYRTVPASRRMTIFPTFDRGDVSRLRPLFRGHGSITELTFFRILGLCPVGHVLDDKKQLPYTLHVNRHRAFLRNQAAEEKALILESLAEERARIAAGQMVAWVDVGWALSSVASLNKILGYNIPAFCIGSHELAHAEVPQDGYLFEKGLPAEVSQAIMLAVEPVELIFSAPTHSTSRLARVDGGIVPILSSKTTAERIRDGHIVEVWKGALAFVGAFRDLLPGVEEDALRQYNRAALSSLCKAPRGKQYDALGSIPHDRLAGSQVWETVRDFWKPLTSDVESNSHQAAQIAELQHALQIARRRPLKTLKNLLVYRFLRIVGRLSPPLPTRMTNRFARSADKRDPSRTGR